VKVLLDHCVPRRFGRLLTGHQVRTAFEMSWSGLRNGELLAQARPQFDAFLTVDQNVQFQQNLATLPLPVAIIVAPDNRYETLAPYAPAVLDWLSRPLICELVRIESPTQTTRVPARPPRS
jgi:hypothetical protein